MSSFLHWLAVHTGTVNESGPYYGFWSGFGSDLGEAALFGAVVGMFRKHNCHQRWCWRIGRHQAGEYIVCRKHHPELPDAAPTANDVRISHAGERLA